MKRIYISSNNHGKISTITGINYLEDNTVLYLCGNGYKKSDFALIDSCCRKMNIKSPETALK